MKTCSKCGCYVPDKWINCPACNAHIAPVVSKKKTEWNPWKDGTHYTEEKLYEVLSSDKFVFADDAISEYFGVDNLHLIEGYDEWHNRMRSSL